LIKIEIKIEKNEIKSVIVKGHAGDKNGKDIVCAAISAITQTTLSGLLHYGEDYLEWSMDKGNLFIRIKDRIDNNTKNIFNYLLTTMLLGLKAVYKEYPKKVKILFK